MAEPQPLIAPDQYLDHYPVELFRENLHNMACKQPIATYVAPPTPVEVVVPCPELQELHAAMRRGGQNPTESEVQDLINTVSDIECFAPDH